MNDALSLHGQKKPLFDCLQKTLVFYVRANAFVASSLDATSGRLILSQRRAGEWGYVSLQMLSP